MRLKTVLLIFFVSAHGLNLGICNEKYTTQGMEMSISQKSVKNEDRYKNVSTMQSCIEVTIKDAHTGQSRNIIIGNEQFARLLARQRGILVDRMQVKSNQEAYWFFLNEQYVPYMLKNEGNPIDLGLDFGEIKRIAPILIYERPYTFEDLGVGSEYELVEKFFDFNSTKGSGTLKGKYYEKYTRNPAFIALLLTLGYDVVWGDYIPNLNIYTKPFSTFFHRGK